MESKELPQGLVLSIDFESNKYAEACPSAASHISYRAGAVTWAQWKVKYDDLKAKYDHLETKYDNILATESGHESQTENVWQSGYATGHEAGCEKGLTDAAERVADKLMVIVKKQLEGGPALKAQQGGEVRETIENILFKSGKLYQEECTWLADIILQDCSNQRKEGNKDREIDAMALLRWLNENDWSGVGSGEYINSNTGRIIKEARLLREFNEWNKQQKK